MRIGKFIFGGFLLAFALSILAKVVFFGVIAAISVGIVASIAKKAQRWKYDRYLGYKQESYFNQVPSWETMPPSYERSRQMAQPIDPYLNNRYRNDVEKPYSYRTIEVL